MINVILPRIDPTMVEGTIIKWLKKEGDHVEKGEPMASVEGEKVVFEIKAPASGIVQKLIVPEKQVVPIATTIAIISDPNEQPLEVKPETLNIQKIPERNQVKRLEEKILASPLARKIAKDRDIDLKQIKGSGPQGRIIKDDVLGFSKRTKAVSDPEIKETIPLAGLRKTISDRMLQSYRDIPQLMISMEVNMSETLNLKEKVKKEAELDFSITSLITKAAANSLDKFKIINSAIIDDQIRIFKDINICIAIDIDEGLIAPVIKEVTKKNILEITSAIKDLAQKSKDRKLTVEDLKGGTFTISNLGGFGVKSFTPIINPPQAAILGVGRIFNKPIAFEGKILINPIMTLSLVFDHRIVDGAKAARFLNDIKQSLEKPYTLLMT